MSPTITPSSPGYGRLPALGRTLLLVFLLGWVPLLIAGFLCLRVLDGWSELVRERRTDTLARELNRISRLLDPEVSLQSSFPNWAREALTGIGASDATRLERRLGRMVGEQVTIVTFDSNGNIDQKRNDSISNRYVVEKLIRILSRPAEEAIALMRQNRKRLNQV
ncbi:MAG TPA: hypothetical protein PKO06_04150, partial [Candidatus Ozemobacteraceae bacterium]|nr:hypothetical protein [Candidatus Ozemobacteraceae bacterium]